MGRRFRMSRLFRWVLGDSSILFAVPFMFLFLIVSPIEFSSAQEDEATVEVCRPASTVIIATDGGVVDLSALDESEVARVSGAKGSTENVISELKEECGFASFVLVDGDGSQGSNGASALSLRSSDKYTDPLSDAILEAYNYSVAVVEVQKDDIFAEVNVPVCTDDQKASPWLEEDDRGFLWSGARGYLWSGAR
jgi:hypothetical protein